MSGAYTCQMEASVPATLHPPLSPTVSSSAQLCKDAGVFLAKCTLNAVMKGGNSVQSGPLSSLWSATVTAYSHPHCPGFCKRRLARSHKLSVYLSPEKSLELSILAIIESFFRFSSVMGPYQYRPAKSSNSFMV